MREKDVCEELCVTKLCEGAEGVVFDKDCSEQV